MSSLQAPPGPKSKAGGRARGCATIALWTTVGFIALIIIIALLPGGEDPETTPTTDDAAVNTPEPDLTPTPTKAPPKKPTSQYLAVMAVVDGDTIKVRRGVTVETVRLIGVDTPETQDPDEPVGCYGKQASAYTQRLLEGQQVRLQTDASQGRLDKYGRTLAYVWLPNGRMVNEALIRGGYAREYTYSKAYRYQDRFKTAQRKAKASGTGLWKACAPKPAPKPKPKPVPAEPAVDPQFGTCGEAIDAGYGPYVRGQDPEYDWYRDADSDGVVCES